MGLLTQQERKKLIDLLLKTPNITNSTVRDHLLIGLPQDLRVNINYLPSPKDHFTSIVNSVDAESWEEPYETGWPVLQLIENAIYQVGRGSPVARQFQLLLADLKTRAEQWASLNDVLTGLPPQDSENLERMMEKMMGFHDPEAWRARMRQRELAVCLIEFGNDPPKPRGTGFLLGPSVIMTNFHVIEPTISGSVKPKEVVLRFDYKVTSDGLTVGQSQMYQLADDWLIDSSGMDKLDYALLRVAGTPGNDFVKSQPDTPQRKWLTPREYDFQIGEPLFIIQHPEGGFLKFAFDRVKAFSSNRIFYRTNTEHGSSGSPCFTINWELVALHQGFLDKSQDEDQPNQGIPFTQILKQPKLREALEI